MSERVGGHYAVEEIDGLRFCAFRCYRGPGICAADYFPGNFPPRRLMAPRISLQAPALVSFSSAL